jgi:hypothetical protein
MVYHRGKSWLICALLALAAFSASASYAQEHRREAPGPGARGQFYDNRYNHGRYYPPRGAVVRELPGGYRPYFFHGSPFYFSAGIWYAPGPGGFVVVRPPVGLYLSVLPPYYSTVWLGGVPYYYADDTYYQWQPAMNQYEVVAPPPGADQPGSPPPPPGPPGSAAPGAPGVPGDNFYIYPKNGQSPAQQAADRYECHNWAKSQTGFDPTQPGGGVPPDQNAARSAQYNRAMTACLTARDYSVQ